MAHPADLGDVLGALARTSERSDAAGFIERNRAIDQLELRLSELTHALGHGRDADPGRAESAAKAVALRDRLQRINDSMARGLRERVAAASISPRELLATFQQYVGAPRHETRDDLQYDDLDALLAGILSTDHIVEDGTVELDPEMVPYQPTPARLVLALLQELQATERDVFVDVGSGLGTVPTLVSLLTDARAVGIEWRADHCAHAQSCVRRLNLSAVSFVQQDARQADFSTGTIFYMFTPFKGTMLRDVLQRLDGEGRRRTIRLCVYGPFLREALAQFPSFSREKAGSSGDSISVFRSTPVA